MVQSNRHTIFVTGGTGYIGRRLVPRLSERGHLVRALVREGSETKLPPGCQSIKGNALEQASFLSQIQPADTFIQLVGVSHPSPAKARSFAQLIWFRFAPRCERQELLGLPISSM